MIFFTSDTHYNHTNIIRYCRRPFLFDAGRDWEDDNLDVEAMNEAMIQNWNKVVGPADTVYHLGDFALGANLAAEVARIMARLNGRKWLVLGNHDRSRGFYKRLGFQSVERLLEVELDGHRLLLTHKPAARETCDVTLHGHVHEKYRRRGQLINVGVDQWGFTPVTLAQLLAAPNDSL